MEHDVYNSLSTMNLASTIAGIAGFAPPREAAPEIGWLRENVEAALGGKVDNVLIFSADAVPCWLVRKYPELFAGVWRRAPMVIPMRTVMPSVTPVDYAAFFSGTTPDKNGVDRIVKPILSPELTQPLLKCDSLIAAAVRSGRRVCVVTCADGCIASMLSRSGADFRIIPGDDDEAMFRAAVEAVESRAYDFVFLYQLGFDYAQHAHGPESPEALATLETINRRFASLYDAMCEHWQGRTMVLYHTDHGCHLQENGRGGHGQDISEDMDIFHFWGGVTNE